MRQKIGSLDVQTAYPPVTATCDRCGYRISHEGMYMVTLIRSQGLPAKYKMYCRECCGSNEEAKALYLESRLRIRVRRFVRRNLFCRLGWHSGRFHYDVPTYVCDDCGEKVYPTTYRKPPN